MVIPTVNVDTTFGRVFGVTSIATSALAEAQGDLGQEGRVMPFGLDASSAGSTEVCLRDTGGPSVPPCDGPATGNFGTLDFSLFANDSLGTAEACGDAKAQDKLIANMAVGIDHPIAKIDGTQRAEDIYCPIFNSRPNHVESQTGIGSALWDGMIGGNPSLVSGGAPGRLARGGNRISVDSSSPAIDNTGLWHYIDASQPLKPASCGGVTNTSEMATCLSEWKAGSYPPLFRIDIGSAVRFGAVPLLDSDWAKNKAFDIVNIVPVYLEVTMWNCSGATCDIVHFPDDPAASSGVGSDGKKKIEMLTAFVLDLQMLPEPLQSNFPASAEQVDYALIK